MEQHQVINQLADFEVNKSRIEQLQIKHTPKTKSQRLRGFYLTLLGLGVVCQLASALFSSTGVMYYFATKLNQNGFAITLCSIVLLLALEGVKRFTLESFHSQRLDDKHVHKITYFFIVLFGGVSTICGYFGTAYAVKYFAASPTLVDVLEIENNQAKQIKNDTTYWATKKQDAADASATLYAQNHNKEGEIRTVAKKLNISLGNTAQAAQDSLNNVYSKGRERLAALLNKAHLDNDRIKSEHLEWCNSFGFGVAWIVVFLELLFFCSFWWCEGYSRYEVVEGRAVMTAKAEAAQIELLKSQSLGLGASTTYDNGKVTAKDTEEPKDKEKQKAKEVETQQHTPIGFGVVVAKEGDIIKGEGRKKDRVLVEVSGQLRELTLGEINTLIKGQSTAQRIEHLESIKQKLL